MSINVDFRRQLSLKTIDFVYNDQLFHSYKYNPIPDIENTMIIQISNTPKKFSRNPYGKDFHENPYGYGSVLRTVHSKTQITNKVQVVCVDSFFKF